MTVDLFHYPKTLHRRQFSPRLFKNYKTYKRWLQREFSRVCVYCRQPDSYSPNLNFGVDHYRPKSIQRFASLACDYRNLFYCCGCCNSRKKADWPVDEQSGPYVVNPCDHVMADHIRFNARTGRMDTRTPNGEHTAELLQLNDPEFILFRNAHLRYVRLCDEDILRLRKQQGALDKKLSKNQISSAQHSAEKMTIQNDIDELIVCRDRLTGAAPLPPIRNVRMGVPIHP